MDKMFPFHLGFIIASLEKSRRDEDFYFHLGYLACGIRTGEMVVHLLKYGVDHKLIRDTEKLIFVFGDRKEKAGDEQVLKDSLDLIASTFSKD